MAQRARNVNALLARRAKGIEKATNLIEDDIVEETGKTHDCKSRWGDACFEYLKEAPKSFHKWWQDEFEEPEEPQEPKTAKEKLEQAEFVECEVVDGTPTVLGYAH